MTIKIATVTVQKWGNSLALRIPSSIAHSAHFYLGTPVKIALHKGRVTIKTTGKKKLTLEEKLALFDPSQHGGEVMATNRIGREKF